MKIRILWIYADPLAMKINRGYYFDLQSITSVGAPSSLCWYRPSVLWGCLCVALYLTGMYCMVPPLKSWESTQWDDLLLAVCQHCRVTGPQAEAWGGWEACRGGGKEKVIQFSSVTLENRSWETKLFYHPDMTKWQFQNQSNPEQIAEFTGKQLLFYSASIAALIYSKYIY